MSSPVAERARRFLQGEDLGPALRDGGGEVRRIGAIVAAGTLLSVVFHVAVSLLTDLRWPYTSFLYAPSARFFDFLEVYGNARSYGNGGDTNINYSGVLHLLTVVLSWSPSVVAWLLVTTVFLVALVLTVWHGVTARVGARSARETYLAVFCVLSYPVLFLLDRGNLEMVVFALLAAFVYLYYVRASDWACVPLALAVAGKYYWAVLLVLLLSDRRWRQFILTCMLTAVVTIGSAVLLGVTTGYGMAGVLRTTLGTLGGHADNAVTTTAVQHGHSFFSILYFIDRSTGYWLQIHSPLSAMYVGLSLGVFLLVAARLLLYEIEPWRKLAALVICAIALPFESHDYTLVHLFLPLALFGAWGAHTGRGRLYVALFGLLLIPLDYVQFGFGVSYSSLAYSILLLVLLASVVTDRARLRTVPRWTRAGVESKAEA